MNSSRYRLEQIGEEEAGRAWAQSPHATVFTKPNVLQALASRVEWWACYKGMDLLCAWPVPFDEEQRVRQPPFSYWVGPLWTNRGVQIPAHRQLAETTAVYSLFLEEFAARYGRVDACLAPGLLDVRAFDWWNYHDVVERRFRIRPRYTAIIADLQRGADVRAGYRELRRREIRKFERGIGVVPAGHDVEASEIRRLYAETVGLVEEDPETDASDPLRMLLTIASSDDGDVIAFRDESTNELACAVLLLYACGRANMVVNVVGQPWRNRGVMSGAIDTAVTRARAAGADVFDFNGANSPLRGDDKQSYGSSPVLFFDVLYAPQQEKKDA